MKCTLLLIFMFAVAFSVEFVHSVCAPEEFECPTTGDCLPESRLCNKIQDCEDGSDEPPVIAPEKCPACPEGDFRCTNGRCVPMYAVCNDLNDCGDYSDEPLDGDLCPPCLPPKWRCNNGRCLAGIGWVCNGGANCKDGSDEPPIVKPEDCPPCYPEDYYFRCDSGICVWNGVVCDNTINCRGGEDERQNCPPCKIGEQFGCPIGGCIPINSTCDGINDCEDWSDESAEICSCADNEIRCPSPEGQSGTHPPPPGICIPQDFWCDPEGIWDCVDGSDEKNC